MKVFILIIQVILILVMGLFGSQKIFMSLPDLIAQGMLWIEDFPAWQVRTIGILEVLGAFGLFFPYVIKFLPKIIIVIASGSLALTMVGAIITHISRGDVIASVIITSTLCLMAVLVAAFRFKQYKSES